MEVILKSNGESLIGLTLEEYNELLIIKGKYEESKQWKMKNIVWQPKNIICESPHFYPYAALPF